VTRGIRSSSAAETSARAVRLLTQTTVAREPWREWREYPVYGRLEPRVAGDVNGDGSIDVSDVFYMINFLFAGGSYPK
jgi:hypothetical protein